MEGGFLELCWGRGPWGRWGLGETLEGARSHVSRLCCRLGGRGTRRGLECQTPVGAVRCVSQTLQARLAVVVAAGGWQLQPSALSAGGKASLLSKPRGRAVQRQGRGWSPAGGGEKEIVFFPPLRAGRAGQKSRESRLQALGVLWWPEFPMPGSSLLLPGPGDTGGAGSYVGVKAGGRAEFVADPRWRGR